MKFRNLIILALLSSVVSGVIFYGCIRKKEDFIGPEYLSAPADFTASNLVVSDNVNFAVDSCYLTADFSARVTYTITYRGLSSGAVKTFTGVDDNIDAFSAGHIWNGSHEGLNFFRTGEEVEVTLSFLRSDYTLKGTMTISIRRNVFNNPNYLPVSATNNGYEGTLAGFPGQFDFFSTDPCTGFKGSVTNLGAPEGLKCYKMKSVSCQSDGYFIGGVQHRKTGFHMPASWSDPSQIYFNLYVYGNGNANGRLSLEFHEADLVNEGTKPKGECMSPNTPGTPTIAKGEHDPCTDDAWVTQVPFNHVGWKLISIKYSDMIRSVSAANGGSGNAIKEPGRVHRIQVGILSVPTPFEEVDVAFDFPVLSYGAPFDPSK